MKKYIAINKDKLLEKDQEINSAALLWKDEDTLEESEQYIIRVNTGNEDQFRSYIKYGELDVISARKTKGNLSELQSEIVISEPFAAKYDIDGNKFFKRMHSGFEDTESPFIEILAGATEVIDIEIGYPWVKIEAMEVVGAGDNHSASLYVLDTEDNIYSGAPVETFGANYELNQFSFNCCIAKGFHRFYSKYDADLYIGMLVRVEITNWSLATSHVGLNVELNEVTS